MSPGGTKILHETTQKSVNSIALPDLKLDTASSEPRKRAKLPFVSHVKRLQTPELLTCEQGIQWNSYILEIVLLQDINGTNFAILHGGPEMIQCEPCDRSRVWVTPMSIHHTWQVDKRRYWNLEFDQWCNWTPGAEYTSTYSFQAPETGRVLSHNHQLEAEGWRAILNNGGIGS